MKLNINQLSPQVRYTPNVPNVLTPVFTITVPEKVRYTIMDKDLLVMKLCDADGNEIDANSDVVIAGKRPQQLKTRLVDSKKYRAYKTLDVSQQYDANLNASLRINLAKGRLDLIELHSLTIEVNSPDVVDFENSFFELEVDEQIYRDAY